MQLTVKNQADVHILTILEPRLTYPILAPLLAEAERLIQSGARKLVVDMACVTYMDSAAIGCVMDIYRLLQEKKGVLKLSGLADRVETMVSMTGLHKIIDIHREEADAVAAFAATRREKE
ncbi:MAG: STAS domain-containing protein [Vicinamibacteria bacterium]|jgi:anti-anti-sigma factor|nr:STAS domain-containing protein [Vicinamibacteria bacterium]